LTESINVKSDHEINAVLALSNSKFTNNLSARKHHHTSKYTIVLTEDSEEIFLYSMTAVNHHFREELFRVIQLLLSKRSQTSKKTRTQKGVLKFYGANPIKLFKL
jgi:hypothetical protein